MLTKATDDKTKKSEGRKRRAQEESLAGQNPSPTNSERGAAPGTGGLVWAEGYKGRVH